MTFSRSVSVTALFAAILGSWLGAAQAQSRIKAVASFSILGDMTARVGGDRVAVRTIVGADGDAHVYQPTPADGKAIAEADVVIVNGLNFEGWLDRLTGSSAYKGPIIVATKGLTARDGHEAHDHGHGHKTEGKEQDPHAWQSLKNGLVYIRNITDGLCKADADGCDLYRKNAKIYEEEIVALDGQIRADLGKISKSRRKVITTHDAFGYFDEAYGVEFIAPQGVSTDAEASAADVAKLIRQIRKEKVTALFIETISDPRLMEQIGRETGVKPGGALYSDALSAKDGPAATYLDMFKHNASLLTQAMTGS